MSGVCTPVTVVTAFNGTMPHGTTVSAFTSLSLAPPMVLISLDQDSQLLSCVRATRRFGVNVLASDQAAVARIFARKGEHKFDGISWSATSELPRIAGAAGFISCAADSFVPGGDHVVVLGMVEAADSAAAAPLTYHRRTFGTHAAAVGP